MRFFYQTSRCIHSGLHQTTWGAGPTRFHHTPRLTHRDPRRYWLPQVPIGEQGFILIGQVLHASTIPLDSHIESLSQLAPLGTLFVAIGSLRYPLCSYWLPQVPSLWLLAPSSTLFVAVDSLRYPLCGYWLPQVHTLCLLALSWTYRRTELYFRLVRASTTSPYPSTHTPWWTMDTQYLVNIFLFWVTLSAFGRRIKMLQNVRLFAWKEKSHKIIVCKENAETKWLVYIFAMITNLCHILRFEDHFTVY